MWEGGRSWIKNGTACNQIESQVAGWRRAGGFAAQPIWMDSHVNAVVE